MHVLIAIEGIDGSGKGTQTTLLAERLEASGHSTQVFRFPQYDRTFFGKEVGLYLNGDFGPLESINPKFSALLYALDRFQAREAIVSALAMKQVVICDRYTSSNIAHQTARSGPQGGALLESWINQVESRVLGLPPADLTVFLDMDVARSKKLVSKKDKRSYTDRSHDLHEESDDHLSNALSNFRRMAEADDWVTVKCTSGGKLRARDDIAEEIYALVRKSLNES